MKAENEENQSQEEPPVTFSDDDLVAMETENGKVIFSLESTEKLIEEQAELIPHEPVLIEKAAVRNEVPEEQISNDSLAGELTEITDELPLSESELLFADIPAISGEPLLEAKEEEPVYQEEEVTEAPFEFEISLNVTDSEELKTEEPVAEESEPSASENMPEYKQEERKSEELVKEVKAEEKQTVQNTDESDGGIVVKIKPAEPDPHAELFDRSRQRILRLKEISMSNLNSRNQAELEKEPAFKRRNVILDENPKQGPAISRLSLGEDEGKGTGFKPNGYLHDKAD